MSQIINVVFWNENILHICRISKNTRPVLRIFTGLFVRVRINHSSQYGLGFRSGSETIPFKKQNIKKGINKKLHICLKCLTDLHSGLSVSINTLRTSCKMCNVLYK